MVTVFADIIIGIIIAAFLAALFAGGVIVTLFVSAVAVAIVGFFRRIFLQRS